MSFSDLTLVYDCGYGGCQAPARPVPVFCPDPSGSRQINEAGHSVCVLNPVGNEAGFFFLSAGGSH